MARFNRGWVKAWREAAEGDLPQNIWLWGIWNWLIYNATWKPSKILWNGKQREIPPGTVVMGLIELSSKWGCSKNTIKKWLQYLEKTERISLEMCTRGTLVTIRNWDVYQGREEEECTPTARQVNTDCTPAAHEVTLSKESKKEELNTIEHRKRYSRVKSDFDLEKLYKGYPRKKGKTPGLKKLAKEIKTEADYLALAEAIKNYAADSAGKDAQYIQFFSTFAGQWRDWIQIEQDNSQFSINTTPIELEAS